ncbi:hypothetical protein Q8A64_14660 [Oxalobacteraceae bacterium R-40]|uniref:TonB C-terminal domain-containing protein n=1 Tax=Keguizhuia sedimenti TaxID=3064264 RepID=A0ABU1BRT1_9BURK|nr:hypothetical protein [Oxalobacteraceae bacterium R-40]
MTKLRCWQGSLSKLTLPAIQQQWHSIGWPQIAAFGLSCAAHSILAIVFQYGHDESDAASFFHNTRSSPIVVSIVYPQANHPAVLSASTETASLPLPPQNRQPLMRAPNETSSIPIHKQSEPYYFPVKELTEKPLVSRDIPPDLGILLPEVASQSVGVWLFINEAGEIDRIKIGNSDLPPYAEVLLREYFGKVKFYPGKIDGAAVKSKLKIEVVIEPEKNSQRDPNRSLVQ